MHTIAWLSWIGLVMGVSLTTTNPYALAIVLLCILLVNVLAPRTGTAVAGFRSLLILGVGLCAISVAVAVVNGNYGSHILFTIPGPHIPDWLGGLRDRRAGLGGGADRGGGARHEHPLRVPRVRGV